MGSLKLALIDYGAGNLNSVRKAFRHLGASVLTPERPDDLSAAAAVVVPGVGNFLVTATLDAAWRQAILTAIERGRPLLGICLGLQWLYEGSAEAPAVPGVGLFRGVCTRLDGSDVARHTGSLPRLKIPHVGWNSLHVTRRSQLLNDIPDEVQVYFTHSYAAPVGPECLATTTYGTSFTAIAARDRVCAVQFHPEKSGDVGLTILKNFLEQAQ